MLGTGALAHVYEGVNTVTGDLVAIKVPKADVPFGAYHLRAEYRARIGVHHANLVSVRELLDGPEGPWLILGRADGVPLCDCIHSGLSDAFISKVGEEVLAGVRALYNLGRWHGDIKPANIIVGPDGSAQLVDFDLSWSIMDDWDGAVEWGVGTPDYAAPEVVLGARPNVASDLFSLGLVLCEAVLAGAPFGSPLERPLDGLGRLIVDLPDHTEPALVAQIRQLLGPVDERMQALGTAVRPAQDFFGREEELERLAGVLESRSMTHVVVNGPAGVGKTRLVNEFLRSVIETRPGVVWRSRCHPSARVPFAGVDGWVEGLGRHLAQHPDLLQDKTMARAVGKLRAVFGPLLPDVLSVASSADQVVQAAAQSLGIAVSLVSQHLPVYLWLDDAHWMAGEAEVFVETLVRLRPDNVVMVVTTRQLDVDADVEITLQDLSEDAARQWSESVGRELTLNGRANPMLLGMALESSQSSFDASAVVRARVLNVAQQAHDVLVLAAVATTPLGRSVLDACGISDREVEHALGSGLLVVGRMDGEPAVELVHDLVRVTVTTVLQTREVEQGLLDVLLRTAPDRPARVAHHMANLHHDDTAVWALRAAEQARVSFAWEQASRWFDVAVAHGHPPNDVDWLRAELLGQSGRVADALVAWTAVAETSTSKKQRVLALGHGAALAYGTGDMAKGHSLAGPAVRALGMQLRPTMVGAFGQAAWWTVRRLLWSATGGKHQPDDAEAPLRLRLAWTIAGAMCSVDGIRGIGWLTRQRYEAERYGDAVDLARGRAVALILDASPGLAADEFDRRLDQMQVWRGQSTSALERATYDMGSGYGAFASGETAHAHRLLSGSQMDFASSSYSGWESRLVDKQLAWTAQYQGEFDRMSSLGDAVATRCERVGNVVPELQMRLVTQAYYSLVIDDVEAADREITEIQLRSGDSEASGVRYFAHHARALERLYVGDSAGVPGVVRQMMGTSFRLETLLQARIASTMTLALAAAQQPDPKGLKRLQTLTRKLAKERSRWPLACASGLAGCVAWMQEDAAESERAYREAVSQFEAIGMGALADSCRAHLGTLLGSQLPLLPLTQRGVVDPVRFLRMTMPGPASHAEFQGNPA